VAYPGVEEIDSLGVRSVRDGDDAQRVDGSLGLDANDESALMRAGAVGGVGVDRVGVFDDDGFFGVACDFVEVGTGDAGVVAGAVVCARGRCGLDAIMTAIATTRVQNFRAGIGMGVTGIAETIVRV
jgi:hypothetical protein